EEYGEWHGLSAMTFCKWIKGYVNTTKISAMRELEKIKKMENQEKEPTPEELVENKVKWLKHFVDKYNDYLKSDLEEMDYHDFMNKLFHFLYRLEILKVSDKKGDKYLKRAKVMMRSLSKRHIDEEDMQRKAKQLLIMDWLKDAKKKKVDLAVLIELKDGWEFIKTWEE
ncbi:unnamed protein product, partial [marine sediment metagenome]